MGREACIYSKARFSTKTLKKLFVPSSSYWRVFYWSTMTRFNPAKQHKSSIDWSVLAYQTADNDKAAQTLVIGLVVGVAIAGTSPLLGAAIGTYFVVKGIQKACNADKNKKYIRSSGCVAHILEGGNFRAYLDQNGEEQVLAELQFAERESLTFSDDAMDFFEEKGTQPVTQLQQAPPIETEPTNPQPNQINIIEEMTARITNTAIVGIPGSGKGILISNAIREAKRKHSELRIFVIDPKNDPKELGYFNECDVVERFACMDAKPSAVAVWAETCFDKYVVYANKNTKTLLVIDEGTMLGNKLQQAKSTLLVDKLTSYTSGGDSTGRNVWFAMQSPYVGGSLNLSIASQMTSIVIAFQENIGALAQWKSAKIFKSLSLDVVADLIEKSSTGRAIYFGKTGQWYAMPKLNNYSGYDRDSRQYLPGFTSQSETTTSNLDAVTKLENSLNSGLNVSELSGTAQVIVSWIVANRLDKWVKFRGKEGRDMSFIKFLSENKIDAETRDKIIQELVNARNIDISPEGDSIKLLNV